MTEPTPPNATDAAPPEPAPLPPGVDPALLDDLHRVTVDLRCAACTYNVRTLHVLAHCPECNHPVLDTVRGVHLERMHEEWVNDITVGAAALTVTHGASAVMCGVWMGVLLLGADSGPGGAARLTVGGLSLLILPLGAIIGLTGTLALISLERGPGGITLPVTLRRTIRGLVITIAVTLPLSILMGCVTLRLTLIPGAVLAAASAALACLTPRYAAILFARTDDERGGQRAQTVAKATLILVLLAVPCAAAGFWQPALLNGIVGSAAAVAVLQAICYRRLWRAGRSHLQAAQAAARVTGTNNA